MACPRHQFSLEIVRIFCEFVRNVHRDYYHSYLCAITRYNTRNSGQVAWLLISYHDILCKRWLSSIRDFT